MDKRVEGSKEFVTTAEAEALKNRIGAFSFVECSAVKKINLDSVFDEAIRAIEDTSARCTIL
jgi:Ras-related C3 botulinum toxin substrate 1